MILNYSEYELNDKEKLMFYSIGYAAAATAVYLFYHSILLSLFLGLLIIRVRPFYEKHLADRRMERLGRQFKDLLYSLSASVSSGRQMSEALIEASDNLSIMYEDSEPIMAELTLIKRGILENNESDRTLLADFAHRSANEDINNFVQVYITCRNMGGDLEKIITHTSDILTDKMNIEREIKAITAQKKLEGRLISLMPAAMLLMLNLLSPSYVAPLYEGLLGRLIMTGCLGAACWGIYMMEKISDIGI